VRGYTWSSISCIFLNGIGRDGLATPVTPQYWLPVKKQKCPNNPDDSTNNLDDCINNQED
jgi:hypothetical protein